MTNLYPQALCRPGGGEVPVHERDAAGDQVQRASQHHLQQQDQPRRPVTNPPGVTRQALSQELHGIIITTNMWHNQNWSSSLEQYKGAIWDLNLNVFCQHPILRGRFLCTTMKIQPKSMHLLKILKYLNKSVWPNYFFSYCFNLSEVVESSVHI